MSGFLFGFSLKEPKAQCPQKSHIHNASFCRGDVSRGIKGAVGFQRLERIDLPPLTLNSAIHLGCYWVACFVCLLVLLIACLLVYVPIYFLYLFVCALVWVFACLPD